MFLILLLASVVTAVLSGYYKNLEQLEFLKTQINSLDGTISRTEFLEKLQLDRYASSKNGFEIVDGIVQIENIQSIISERWRLLGCIAAQSDAYYLHRLSREP